LLESLVQHPAVEHVIYRAPEPDSYVVASQQGRRTLTARSARSEAEPPAILTAHTGRDPLGYEDLPVSESVARLAELTADSDYPDALWQIVQFFRSSRAGDLVVNARNGFDLRGRFEYQPHNGSHGGLHKDHMLVPALVNGRWAQPRLRTVDLFPSMLAALGLPVPPGLDGEVVPIEPS
jgi:hypothetical protein